MQRRTCTECGSRDLFTDLELVVNNGVPQGRLRTHDMEIRGVLACGACDCVQQSLTEQEIATYVTALLSIVTPAALEGYPEGNKNA